MSFLDRFSNNTQIKNFKKILPVGVELFHAEGQTDMTKVIVVFRNFVSEPKKSCSYENLEDIYYLEPFTLSKLSIKVFKIQLKTMFFGQRIGLRLHEID